MKKIYILLSLLIILFITSCNNKYNIEFIISDEYKEFIDIDNISNIKKNKEINLPQIESNTYTTYQYHLDNEIYAIIKKDLEYNFIEWKNIDNEESYTDKIKINSNQKLELVLDTKSTETKIVLHLNGGKIYAKDVNPTFLDMYELPILSKEDYAFDGWYYDEKFSSDEVFNIKLHSLYTIHLYAKFLGNVDTLNDLILDLPSNLTLDDIEHVEYLNEIYESLSKDDQNKVVDLEKLNNALTRCETLKQIKTLNEEIASLPNQDDILASYYPLTNNLMEIYNTLSTNDKKLVSDYSKLSNCHWHAELWYQVFISDARKFDERILEIPSYAEYLYKDDITALYEEYQRLDRHVKSLLKLTSRLEELNELITNTTSNKQEITYVVNSLYNPNVYLSKETLFKAFFTDFYYYIVYKHGTTLLEEKGIKTLDDFLKIASDYNAGRGEMREIGDIASSYLLKKDLNGILSNQTESTFFGFCYKHDRYIDFINFFTNAFSYWRRDEGYANTSNYGADIFAESWAPVVDIAKFFYYDELPSYLRTERMLNYFNNIQGVVYGFDPTDLSKTPTLRGYKFEGWYLNDDYSGEKITSLENIGNEKIVLYALFTEDAVSKEKDAAEMVDVYIYNLTTTKAKVNKTTVKYVLDMYDKLSESAKALVKDYETLLKLKEKVGA